MSPGLRLVAAPAALLAAALICFMLPRRLGGLGRLVGIAAVAGSSALLLSTARAVAESGRIERGFGELVTGISLTVRGDGGGLAIALLASAIALAALVRQRHPVVRTGLLLCLAGTVSCALAGNVVLLFGGMELGNIGALIIAGARQRPTRGQLAWFAVQHLAALGLLGSAVQLQTRLLTTDLTALPPEPVSGSIAVPWAMAGITRMVAVAGLTTRSRSPAAGISYAVAAVPSALIVLLRLIEVRQGKVPQPVPALLLLVGSVILIGAGVVALRVAPHVPAAARALCVGGAGLVLIGAGTGSGAALTAAATCGVALVLAIAAVSGIFDDPGGAEPGRRPAWADAAAVAVAGCLPIGLGFTGLVLAADAAVAGGLPGSMVALNVAFGGVLLLVAGARAARSALGALESDPARLPASLPMVLGLCASVLGALLPGVAVSLLVSPIAATGGSSPVTVIDAMAVRGPGGGWAGGYVSVAVMIAVAAALAAGVITRRPDIVGEPRLSPPPPQLRRLAALVARAGRVAARGDVALAAADSWMVVQPGLAFITLGAAVFIFSFR